MKLALEIGNAFADHGDADDQKQHGHDHGIVVDQPLPQLLERTSLGRALEALAAVAVAAGDPELAGTLFGAADGVRRAIGAGVWVTDRASHDKTAAQLRTQLGDSGYAAQLTAAAASPLMRYWSWPRVTSRALGQDMKQQGRRPTEVARAMTRPSSGIEVLPESGT